MFRPTGKNIVKKDVSEEFVASTTRGVEAQRKIGGAREPSYAYWCTNSDDCRCFSGSCVLNTDTHSWLLLLLQLLAKRRKDHANKRGLCVHDANKRTNS